MLVLMENESVRVVVATSLDLPISSINGSKDVSKWVDSIDNLRQSYSEFPLGRGCETHDLINNIISCHNRWTSDWNFLEVCLFWGQINWVRGHHQEKIDFIAAWSGGTELCFKTFSRSHRLQPVFSMQNSAWACEILWLNQRSEGRPI